MLYDRLFLGSHEGVVFFLADSLVPCSDASKFIVGGVSLDAHAVLHVQGILATNFAVFELGAQVAIDISYGKVLLVAAQYFKNHIGFTVPVSYVAWGGIVTACGKECRGCRECNSECNNLFHGPQNSIFVGARCNPYCKMQFILKHLYLLAPVLAVLLAVFVYQLIQENRRPIPKYESKYVEDTWSPEEYMRHLKAQSFNKGGVHRLLLQRTRQKAGVYLESLEPVMDSVGLTVVNVFHNVLGDDYTPVITSGNDYPYHARNSKHYENKALDFRIKYIPIEKRRMIAIGVEDKLRGRCRVIWEKGEAEHLHVELLD